MKKEDIQNLIIDHLDDTDSVMRPLSRFKINFSSNEGFHKIFFAASCTCGTSALLSVEVSESKSDNEIEAAMTSIVERLIMQEKSFRRMDCKTHENMKRGFLPENHDK